MSNLPKWLKLLGPLALAAALHGPPAVAQLGVASRATLLQAEEAPGAHEFTLANGMRVIVKQDHRAPVVAHMVLYLAGSLDEFNGTTGVAHVLEHMMFKGTKDVGPGEFSRRIAALGGRENAYTTRDYTAYHQQIEKSRLPEVMRLEADRMANLVVSKAEFDKEIRVVMEERRLRTDDSAKGLLYEQLLATAFNASPAGRPVVGWMSDLQNMNYKDAQAWHERWYAPNNAILLVAGDVDPQQVLALARQYYEPVPARALPERKPQDEPQQRGLRRISVKAPAENPYVILAWKVPPLRDPEKDVDPYALAVLSAVLDGYDNSRLNRVLVRERRLADQVGAGYDMTGRPSQTLFMLDGTPAKGKTTAEIEQALRAQIAQIARDGVSASELSRVKAQLVAGQVYKRDSLFGQAMEIASMESAGHSWRDIDRVLARLKAVTAEQVKSVAARYFGDDTLVVATLLPQPVDPNRRIAAPALRH